MGTGRITAQALVLSHWVALACGGQTATDERRSAGGGTGGAQASLTHSGGASGQRQLEGSIAMGQEASPPVCPVEARIDAPAKTSDCQIAVPSIDPVLTCGSADCGITKLLELTCEFLPDASQVSATDDGAAVLTRSFGGNAAWLMTVDQADARVENIPAFAAPDANADAPSYSVRNSVLAHGSSGETRIFAGINAIRKTNAGWMRANVVAPAPPNEAAPIPTHVCMVDEKLGYLTYLRKQSFTPNLAHLVTWDGTCWKDEPIGDARAETLIVESDQELRPWVAWTANSRTLYLRSPDGVTRHLLTGDTGNPLVCTTATDFDYYPCALWFLAGGPDGRGGSPAIAAQFADGIRVASVTETGDPKWLLLLSNKFIPQATTAGNCPPLGSSPLTSHPCLGVSTCTLDLAGSGSRIALVRTRSAATFAAWVEYSSSGSFDLFEEVRGGEMPEGNCWLGRQNGGSGTAELVVAHLTIEAEPVLSRFRFDLDGAFEALPSDLAMTSRGETLILTAHLSHGNSLTYLEIDSTRLP